jgi:hypothetical protein
MYKVMQLDWRFGIHLDTPLLSVMAPDVHILGRVRTLMDFLLVDRTADIYIVK